MFIKDIENKMNHPINELHKKTSLTAKLFLTTALMAVTSVSVAEDNNVAYVDSVLKWGAWELDIEPAAGGISAPTTRALNARGSKVTLRTNSIAALAPASPKSPVIPATPSTPVAPTTPSTPVIPVTPSTPVIPVTPSTPAPPVIFRPPAPTIFAPPEATPPTTVTLP